MSVSYEKPSGEWEEHKDFYGEVFVKKNIPTQWQYYKRKFKARTKNPDIPSKPYTFIIRRGGNMYYSYLREFLKKRGWVEPKNGQDLSSVKIDLHYVDNNKSFWKPANIPFLSLSDTMRNLLEANGKQLIVNKSFLPIIAAKHMPRNLTLTRDSRNVLPRIRRLGKTLILKPLGGHSGFGISVSPEPAEIWDAAQVLFKQGIKSVVVGQYIENPLLFNSKKFHIRMWYVVLWAGPRQVRTFLFNQGAIFTAKSPYTLGNFGNTDIHDSHFGKTTKDILFPEDYPGDATLAFDQMKDILTTVSQGFAPYVSPYEESQCAFETFGVDFMVDQKEKMYLIEINFNPIFKTKSKKFNEVLSKKYFSSVACMLDPIFPSLYKSTKAENHFTPLFDGSQGAGGLRGGRSGYRGGRSGYNGRRRGGRPARRGGWRSEGFRGRSEGFRGRPNNRKKTFILMTSYFDAPYVRKDLESRGYVETSIGQNPRSADFIWADFREKFDRRLYGIQSEFKNDINLPKNSITNKWELYRQVQLKYPKQKFIPHSELWTNSTKLKKTKKYILKPVDGLMGIGTRVIKGSDLAAIDKEQFVQDFLKQLLEVSVKRPSLDVMISDYIPDLLLRQGKIFHIRVYYIPTLKKNKFEAYLSTFGKLIQAEKKFSEKDQFEHNVFDSHIVNNEVDLKYPEDLLMTSEQKKSIAAQMTDAMKKVSSVFHQDFTNYPEIKNGFSVFGVDFMVDKKHKVHLIEVNSSRTGMKSASAKYKLAFTKKMWGVVSDVMLFPVDRPQNVVQVY